MATRMEGVLGLVLLLTATSWFIGLPATFLAPRVPAEDVTPPSVQLRGASEFGASSGSQPMSGIMAMGVVAVGASLLLSRKTSSNSKVTVRAFENELGVQPPVGFWDPAGFTADGDARDFFRRRCVEIKHGRVSMLAAIGYITPEYFKWPGYLSTTSGLKFADVPHGLAALTKVPAIGWTQVVGFCGAMELFAMNQPQNGEPGKLQSRFVVGLTDIEDPFFNGLKWGPFGIPNAPSIADPELRKKKLNAELANGRLAMTAIMAMLFQNGTVGTTGPEMWLPPPSAFENELGVQAPVGFWDPAGLAADGDAATFKRRRAVELKHGRVSMYACIGFIVPEYTRFPGDLSPTNDLKFTDIPNGLGAFSKVPILGWLQILAFAGLIEKTAFFTKKPTETSIGFMKDASMDGEPGNFGLGFIGAFNTIPGSPQLRARKLNAELANGRLAMTAILAMFFQNGTVGTTGPEMWWFPAPPEYATTVGDFIPKGI